MNQLDSFDRAILNIIQTDASLSYAEIGERVHLSASATLRRVQRMKKNGTILATRAILDPEKIGHSLTILVEVTLENERAEGLSMIKQKLIEDACVQQCYYVTGDKDIFIILTIENMMIYNQFIERHLFNKFIKKFKTSISMKCIKSKTSYEL